MTYVKVVCQVFPVGRRRQIAHMASVTTLKSDLWTHWVPLNETIQTCSAAAFHVMSQSLLHTYSV